MRRHKKHIGIFVLMSLLMVQGGLSLAATLDRPFFQNIGIVIVWGSNNFGEAGGTAPIVSDFVLLDGVASGTEGTDLIAANVGTVATGSLAPLNFGSPTVEDGVSSLTGDFLNGAVQGGEVTDNSPTGILDASDTLTSFEIDAGTGISGQGNDHKASFFVASNTAFDIHGQLFNPIATGDFLINFTLENITYDMGVTVSGDDDIVFGTAAQDPSIGGTGPVPNLTTLASFGGGAGQIQVYGGGQKTARSPGSIAEQSVRFDLTYSLDGDTDTDGIQPFDLSFGNGTISMFMVYTVFAP